MDLERFLSHNGFVREYAAILNERGIATTKNVGEAGYEDEVADLVKKKEKPGAALRLIEKLRAGGATAARVPGFFETLIRDIVQKTS